MNSVFLAYCFGKRDYPEENLIVIVDALVGICDNTVVQNWWPLTVTVTKRMLKVAPFLNAPKNGSLIDREAAASFLSYALLLGL
jgi:hypothetical protein